MNELKLDLIYNIGLVSMTHMDTYVTPTNDTNYSCHMYKSQRTYLTNHMEPIERRADLGCR